MSDAWLRYVPSDPCFRPTAEAAHRLVEGLRRLHPEAQQIDVSSSTLPRFVDPGQNWDGVVCPHCQTEIEDWWDDEMSRLADEEGEFVTLKTVTPCCEQATPLDELVFRWPAAYSCFVVDVMNPNHAGLHAKALRELSEAAGFPLLEIAQRL